MTTPNDTPEPSLASAGSQPEAWAVEWRGDTKIDRSTVCYTEDAAKRRAGECPALGGAAVPLYRATQPALTDEEKAAIALAKSRLGMSDGDWQADDVLAALLERLG